ncbi:hypothetical protein Neosp_009158 [[Neocosmospora] mangrovei]
MRPGIAVSLAFGLLGADLAKASYASSPTSTDMESSTTLLTSVTTSAESINTSSSEAVSDSTTTLATESTTAESTTASTTFDSSTAQTTTSEPASTDSSRTESFQTTSTSSAPTTNPTFNLIARSEIVDGEYLQNDPAGVSLNSMLLPTDSSYVNVPVYIEEGTNRLKTLFADYYLCAAGQWTLDSSVIPAEIQLCNTWRFVNGDPNRLQYLTCELTADNGISCSAPGMTCLIWYEGPRQTKNQRCDLLPETTFTQFFMASYSGVDDYLVYLGPDESFVGYEAGAFKWTPAKES